MKRKNTTSRIKKFGEAHLAISFDKGSDKRSESPQSSKNRDSGSTSSRREREVANSSAGRDHSASESFSETPVLSVVVVTNVEKPLLEKEEEAVKVEQSPAIAKRKTKSDSLTSSRGSRDSKGTDVDADVDISGADEGAPKRRSHEKDPGSARARRKSRSGKDMKISSSANSGNLSYRNSDCAADESAHVTPTGSGSEFISGNTASPVLQRKDSEMEKSIPVEGGDDEGQGNETQNRNEPDVTNEEANNTNDDGVEAKISEDQKKNLLWEFIDRESTESLTKTMDIDAQFACMYFAFFFKVVRSMN